MGALMVCWTAAKTVSCLVEPKAWSLVVHWDDPQAATMAATRAVQMATLSAVTMAGMKVSSMAEPTAVHLAEMLERHWAEN